jgi:N-glycosylase/DNA lyase
MVYDESFSSGLIDLHEDLEEEIVIRLNEFRRLWEQKDDMAILKELFFCILTPQSKAKTCWGAVEELSCNDLLLEGDYEQVLKVVGIVRFKYRKASYIIEARDKFYKDGKITIVSHLEEFDDPFEAREWLVKDVKGFGFKEASHFLRNIGLGENLTILDRHILKNLSRAGVIPEVPSSMTPSRYLDIERRMMAYCDHLDIPPSHLDLMLWYMEAGSIFK